MAHVAKHTRGALGHMCKHYERAKDANGEYIKFSNQNIDPSRTEFNYNLAPKRDISQGEFVKQRCSQVKCLTRKNVNVMCSWVVTAPQELKAEEYQKFFQETYDFLEKRYGKENVVSAYVHMDEVTPHIHFAFVPVVYDKEKGIEKVSAKERVNKSDLKRFHSDLTVHMKRAFGRDIGIENGSTKEGNLKVPQLKEQTEHAERLKTENEVLASKVSELKMEVRGLEAEKLMLADKIASISNQYKEIYEAYMSDMQELRNESEVVYSQAKINQFEKRFGHDYNEYMETNENRIGSSIEGKTKAVIDTRDTGQLFEIRECKFKTHRFGKTYDGWQAYKNGKTFGEPEADKNVLKNMIKLDYPDAKFKVLKGNNLSR